MLFRHLAFETGFDDHGCRRLEDADGPPADRKALGLSQCCRHRDRGGAAASRRLGRRRVMNVDAIPAHPRGEHDNKAHDDQHPMSVHDSSLRFAAIRARALPTDWNGVFHCRMIGKGWH
jgi:hypothetical protein